MPATENQLLRTLENALVTDPHVGSRRLFVESRDGHVVVRGQVGSYFQKQMAQEALLRIEGVEELENRLEVHWA